MSSPPGERHAAPSPPGPSAGGDNGAASRRRRVTRPTGTDPATDHGDRRIREHVPRGRRGCGAPSAGERFRPPGAVLRAAGTGPRARGCARNRPRGRGDEAAGCGRRHGRRRRPGRDARPRGGGRTVPVVPGELPVAAADRIRRGGRALRGRGRVPDRRLGARRADVRCEAHGPARAVLTARAAGLDPLRAARAGVRALAGGPAVVRDQPDTPLGRRPRGPDGRRLRRPAVRGRTGAPRTTGAMRSPSDSGPVQTGKGAS